MTNALRITIEKTIVKQIIDSALEAGYSIGLETSDGEEIITGFTNDRKLILNNVFSCDDARIFLSKDGETYCGWILCVYGNDGTDVVSDYTTNLEELLSKANNLADKIEEGKVKITAA